MDLWGVIPNGDGEFESPVRNPAELPQAPLLETMATCHSLTRIEGELSGDPLDLKMFLSTNWVGLSLSLAKCPTEMRSECQFYCFPTDRNSWKRYRRTTASSR